jgi:glycosyltransferase involved in cell wall biosynthesis
VILGEGGPLVDRLRATGATVEVLAMPRDLRDARKSTMSPGLGPWRSFVDFARYVLAVRRRLRDLHPQLVHTNSLKAAIYGGAAGRLAGIPVIWHIRDRIADDYLPRPAVHLVRFLSRFLPRTIITNSVSTLSTLPLSVRTNVMYNPVLFDVIDPADMSSARTAGGPLVVGLVGRIAAWKGQDIFLRAFAQAFPDGPERARIIGSALFSEDAYEQEIHALAETLHIADRVEWRGFCDEINVELSQLDILVHCSTTPEPFGQVVVEGMASGLPVVAAAAGGPVEIIDDGKDGLLTPPGDVDALAEVLQNLKKDPKLRERLGSAARVSSMRFGAEVAADRLRRVYAQTIH